MKTLAVGHANSIRDIHRAQRALAGNNVFQMRTYWAANWGNVFDEKLATACKDMKFRLGYAKKDGRRDYGDTLDAYLHGAKKINAAMKLRRIARGFAKPMPKPSGKKYACPIAPG